MKGMTFKVLLSALIVSNAFAAEFAAPEALIKVGTLAGAPAPVSAPAPASVGAPEVATGWMTTAGNAAKTVGSYTVTPLWNATKAVAGYTVVPAYNTATAHSYITAGVATAAVAAGLGYAGYRYVYGKPTQAETVKTDVEAQKADTTAVAEQAHAGYSTRAKIAGTAGLTTTVGGIGYGIYKYGMPSLETIKSVPSVVGSSLMALIPSFVSNNVSKKAAMVLGGVVGVSALIGYTWHRIASKRTPTTSVSADAIATVMQPLKEMSQKLSKHEVATMPEVNFEEQRYILGLNANDMAIIADTMATLKTAVETANTCIKLDLAGFTTEENTKGLAQAIEQVNKLVSELEQYLKA